MATMVPPQVGKLDNNDFTGVILMDRIDLSKALYYSNDLLIAKFRVYGFGKNAFHLVYS